MYGKSIINGMAKKKTTPITDTAFTKKYANADDLINNGSANDRVLSVILADVPGDYNGVTLTDKEVMAAKLTFSPDDWAAWAEISAVRLTVSNHISELKRFVVTAYLQARALYALIIAAESIKAGEKAINAVLSEPRINGDQDLKNILLSDIKGTDTAEFFQWRDHDGGTLRADMDAGDEPINKTLESFSDELRAYLQAVKGAVTAFQTFAKNNNKNVPYNPDFAFMKQYVGRLADIVNGDFSPKGKYSETRFNDYKKKNGSKELTADAFRPLFPDWRGIKGNEQINEKLLSSLESMYNDYILSFADVVLNVTKSERRILAGTIYEKDQDGRTVRIRK